MSGTVLINKGRVRTVYCDKATFDCVLSGEQGFVTDTEGPPPLCGNILILQDTGTVDTYRILICRVGVTVSPMAIQDYFVISVRPLKVVDHDTLEIEEE